MNKNYTCESAVSAVKNINAGWNLGNTLDATEHTSDRQLIVGGIEAYETAWGNPLTTREMLETVRSAGFNAIRLPVTWKYHFDSDYNIDPQWLDRVQTIADWILSLDMYCIINLHHDGGCRSWIRASRDCFERVGKGFARLWEQIADRFAEYGGRIMFEAVNEPLNDDGDWRSMKQEDYDAVMLYNQLFVDTVRSRGGYNPTRNLLVMPYAGAHSNERLGGFAMPKDSTEGHLILEVHNYDPTGFCWHNSEEPARDFWGNESDMELLYSSMRDIAHHAKRFGVPAVIGEFGVEYKENDSERAKYAWHFAKSAGDLGIKCFWWDCGHFSLIDRESCRISHPDVTDALTRYDS